MDKLPKAPKCPMCNRPGKSRNDGLWLCPIGHGLFDGVDEGGTHYADPSKRLEKQEELAAARKENERRRVQEERRYRR